MINPRYPIVLFDLDHTLFDSDESERLAFAATMHAFDSTAPQRHFDAYRSINQALWRRVEAGELEPTEVRTERFRRFVSGIGSDLDPEALADRFVVELGAHGSLYDGARDLLEFVSVHSELGLVTNGLGEVQRARLSRLGLDGMFRSVVISGEVGVAKPAPGIFDIAFADFGHPKREDVLMVGDSLTSDIAGGHGYGIATCWLNPSGEASPEHVTHTIGRLSDLRGLW